MKRRGEERRHRAESWVLIHPATRHEAVLPDGEQQIAELIEIPLDDLTSLPFGVKSTMWMSRSKQLDHEAPLNTPASHALRIFGLSLDIRGDVVVHHEAADMKAEREKLLRAQKQSKAS